jgi:transposase
MVHYVGLDVSLKQTSICVVNQAGSVVREGVVDSDPEAIASFVRSKAPGAVRIGLETGATAGHPSAELATRMAGTARTACAAAGGP